VILETDSTWVSLLPSKGFDIHELVDRASGVDVLFKTPWGWREPSQLPPLGTRRADWLARYPGGWQVLIPTAGDDTIADGSPEGFHGEAAIVPWVLGEVTATSAAASVELVSAPLRLERTVTLEGATLTVVERVSNLSPVPQQFHWVHHPAFGEPFLGPAATLEVPAGGLVTQPGPGDLVADTRHEWPFATVVTGGVVDLAHLPTRDEPRAVFGTLVDLREGRYTLTSAGLGLAVDVRWDLATFPYAWFWQELTATQGYPWFRRAYVTAVEPASHIPGTGAVGGHQRGNVLTVDGNGERSTVLTMSLRRTAHERSTRPLRGPLR
jgi:hypothetical protein